MTLLIRTFFLIIFFEGSMFSENDPFVWNEDDYIQVKEKNSYFLSERFFVDLDSSTLLFYFKFPEISRADLGKNRNERKLSDGYRGFVQVGKVPFIDAEFIERISEFYDYFPEKRLVMISCLEGDSETRSPFGGFAAELKKEFSTLPPVYGIFGFSADSLIVSMDGDKIRFVILISKSQETAKVFLSDGVVIYPLRMRKDTLLRIEDIFIEEKGLPSGSNAEH